MRACICRPWPFCCLVQCCGVELGGEGVKAYKYMCAFFGIICCVGLGVIVSFFIKVRFIDDLSNLVVGHFKSDEMVLE